MNAKYTRKALPGQLPLFSPDMEPPEPNHDPCGMAPASVAQWLLDHGGGRLARPERTFLFGVTLGRHLAAADLDRLSDLHRRIGGRGLQPQPSQTWR